MNMDYIKKTIKTWNQYFKSSNPNLDSSNPYRASKVGTFLSYFLKFRVVKSASEWKFGNGFTWKKPLWTSITARSLQWNLPAPCCLDSSKKSSIPQDLERRIPWNLNYLFLKNFLVDGFHFKGHTNCSHGFNSSSNNVMKGLSSVLHEQKNSQLAKLKLQSIFMRFDCFISLMKVLTTLMNIRELKKLKIN